MRKTIITAGLAAALATTGFVGTAAANPLLIPLIAGAVVGGAAVGTTAAADDYGPAYSDEVSSYTYVQPEPSYTYVQPQPSYTYVQPETSYTYVQPSVTYQRTYTPTYRSYTTAYSTTSHTAWCEAHYRSYNPSTDSFISYSGVETRCVSPYG